MRLNINKIKGLRAKAKPYKVADGRGLSLQVNPNGSKWWRFYYRHNGKQKTLSMGTYPDTGLAQARDKAFAARQAVAAGRDPASERKAETAQKQNTTRFELIAREWFNSKRHEWTDKHAAAVWHSLESNVFEQIGQTPVQDITAQTMLDALKRIEGRGSLEILKKVRQRCKAVFTHAKIKGLITSNPVDGLETVLQSPTRKNYSTIQLKELPALIQAIDTHDLEPTTRAGLKIALLTFLRTNEIRFATWDEIDFDNAQWLIPAERMKMHREHIVPLSRQAIEVLKALQPITGHYPYIFASTHKPETQPMSENAMLYALYRMGYHGRMTVHGFRHLASTTLHECEFEPHVIEKQLSHENKNPVAGAYNKAQYLPRRTTMMQFWADFIDNHDGTIIVPIKYKSA